MEEYIILRPLTCMNASVVSFVPAQTEWIGATTPDLLSRRESKVSVTVASRKFHLQ
eukprot:COSAG02_NODE_6223_length_3716_cov_36.667957_2_plen_56_part_00